MGGATIKQAVAILRDLAANGPARRGDPGICNELVYRLGQRADLLPTLMAPAALWPKFSGSGAYPVRGGAEYYAGPGRWKGERGELRRELCAFLADHWEGHESDAQEVG